jgi:hypothetical protein
MTGVPERRALAAERTKGPPAALQPTKGRTMSISLPTNNLLATPRALFDIIRLEAGPSALPATKNVLIASLAAYGVAEAANQMPSRDILPSIVYGALSTGLLVGVVYLVLLLVKTRDRFMQTLIAIAAIGAVVAFVSAALQVLVGVVFPPPLPTTKLVGFVLFPLVLWKATLYMWIFRHGGLRFIPSLCVSAALVGFTLFILAPLVARIFSFL